ERNYFGLIHVKDEIVIKEEPFNFQEEHTPNNKICQLDQNQEKIDKEPKVKDNRNLIGKKCITHGYLPQEEIEDNKVEIETAGEVELWITEKGEKSWNLGILRVWRMKGDRNILGYGGW
ncbi:Thioredoxin domain-containing protein 9, partial [Armadillidium vulgare]